MAHCSTSSTSQNDPSPKHNLDKQTYTHLNIDLKGTVLTPVACSSLISELLKTLLFQKAQIPYPFNWLKSVVDRKRRKEANEQESAKRAPVAMERHFRLVSGTYDNLEAIMCHIRKEMESSEVREVVLLFGATPFTPKQAYSIKLPVIVRGHLEVNHHQANYKNQQSILKQILLSTTWINATERKTLPSTNMYVLLKKTPTHTSPEDDFFHPIRKFSVSPRVENVVINLWYQNPEESNCCSNLQIFGDTSRENSKLSVESSGSSSDDCEWYQAQISIAGFKDYYVGKVSATDLW